MTYPIHLVTSDARSLWKSAKLVEKSNPEGINQYTGGGGGGGKDYGSGVPAGESHTVNPDGSVTDNHTGGTATPSNNPSAGHDALAAHVAANFPGHTLSGNGKTTTTVTPPSADRSMAHSTASSLRASGFNAKVVPGGPFGQGAAVRVTH